MANSTPADICGLIFAAELGRARPGGPLDETHRLPSVQRGPLRRVVRM